MVEERRHTIDAEEGPKKYAGGRTKEEILAQRKQMMKPKAKKQEERKESPPKSKKEDMMDRLSKGEKTKVSLIHGQVDKKEMLKLTNKNYQLLPEVQKKQEEEKKKKEYKERMNQVKEFEKK